MEQVTTRFMNWTSALDDATCEQVRMTSEMPFVHPHVALVPDAHLGKGACVNYGDVRGYTSIGCGMTVRPD